MSQATPSRLSDFCATTLKGEEISLARYAGKVTLVVNTASKCGFTPQYAGLEKLWQEFGAERFVILGFPCNQFGNQEPGGAEQTSQCLINYGVSFPMFAKVEVNGNNAHPLFTWLKVHLRGHFGKAIKWNFTKFLLAPDGTPLKRFSPATAPEKIAPYIRKALGG